MLTYFLIAMMLAGLLVASLGKYLFYKRLLKLQLDHWSRACCKSIKHYCVIGFILFWRASVPEEDPKNMWVIKLYLYKHHHVMIQSSACRLDHLCSVCFTRIAPGTAQQIQNHALYQQSILTKMVKLLVFSLMTHLIYQIWWRSWRS